MTDNGPHDDTDDVIETLLDDEADGADLEDAIAAAEETDTAPRVTISRKHGDDDERTPPEIPPELPLLPIRDEVAFPGTVMPINIGRERSKTLIDEALAGTRLIGVLTQRRSDVEDPDLDELYRVGTACRILKLLKLPDGTQTILVVGVARIGIECVTSKTPYLQARVHAAFDPPIAEADAVEVGALEHNIRHIAERVITLMPNAPDYAKTVLDGIKSPGGLADFLAANLALGLVHKQELLETFDVISRLRKVHAALAGQLEVLELSHKLQEQVRSQMEKSQREYFLREQMKAIQTELGQDDVKGGAVGKLREKLAAAKLPPAIEAEAKRELERLGNIPAASPEYSVTIDYLEWLAALPWGVSTEDQLDVEHAGQVLDEDHYDLTKIKKRILEFLAVQQLKRERAAVGAASTPQMDAESHTQQAALGTGHSALGTQFSSRGPILCFAGPPGVGKTSLGQSIARAMGRKFIRVSLGGIRDEADIRGHRRTYIGSLPGRIIQELRKSGSNNPVFMLDEVDKIGQDFRGDPASALLEVLDPAQNSTFTDHYLDVPFDLSNVLFVATANYMDAIPPALRDRMEVLTLSGYTQQEKLLIGKRYLVPRQLAENGLTPEQVTFDDDAIAEIIASYTREAGVRNVERAIGSVCRARAAAIVGRKDRATRVTKDNVADDLGPPEYESEVASRVAVPGVVTGLAFTPVGGEILFIEASRMYGSGNLSLTGQIGNVMRESAQAAFSIVKARAAEWGLDPRKLRDSDIHMHVPAGAVPKDGPSAGVAMFSALYSLLTNRIVDPATGMTGEITLRGLVLPVGGIKEKVLAAHRAGLKRVMLPDRNRRDLEEVPAEVRNELTFGYVKTIDELLSAVFQRAAPGRARRSERAPKRVVAKVRNAAATDRRSKPRAAAPGKTHARAADKNGAARRGLAARRSTRRG